MLSFRTILHVGKVRTLHRWMARATATEIDAMQRFVRKLRQDLGAVEGAVTERWSNGKVEGHINRLKTLRRQMYGRAASICCALHSYSWSTRRSLTAAASGLSSPPARQHVTNSPSVIEDEGEPR
jgi:transposase